MCCESSAMRPKPTGASFAGARVIAVDVETRRRVDTANP